MHAGIFFLKFKLSILIHFVVIICVCLQLGRTPFHYAQVLLEGDELTEYMLQKGADIHVKDVVRFGALFVSICISPIHIISI